MKRSIRGIAFVVLGLSVVSMAMAAPPVITITAPASENQIINGTFTFIANVIYTNENLNTVYFNFTNSSGLVNSSENLVNQPASFSYLLNTQTLDDGDYIFTVTATNENITPPNSTTVTRNFTVNNTLPDNTPPSSVTNLVNTSYAQDYINWTWTDPNDSDFSNVTVYLNGTFKTNVSKGTQYYNATGLTSATTYTISTRTVDSSGNINSTWVNHTATTAPLPETTPTNYTPPTPIIIKVSRQEFWINYTWQAGWGNVTDSYNVSVNGVWTNGTTTYNNTKVGPHGWSNITVWAYNNSGSGSLSLTPDFRNTQVENNKPAQYPIGDQTINEGDLLTFTVHATDADNDTITYGTNATKGAFSITTGNFSWTPNYGDAAVYVWYFNSSDNYSGVASETITVTVNDVPLSIASSSPPNNSTTIVGTAQRFEINLNRTANVTWYINSSVVQTNLNVVSANYTNSTAGIGVYNVTAIASDAYDSVPKTWIWTVAPEPRYNVSGYVFDNYGSGLGGVRVQNDSNQNTTNASGYYLITGLLNGTYNFSYYRPGFDIGYLKVTISGADNTSANISIYDTTPPLSVSNPDTSVTVGSFFINNSWVNPPGDFNNTWFRYSNGTDLKNVSAPTNYLNLTWSPHYTQNISAQAVDKYGNVNQTKVWFNATIPNNNATLSNISSSYTVFENNPVSIYPVANDLDTDALTFSSNITKGTFYPNNGTFLWTPNSTEGGIIYNWYINVSDGYSTNTTYFTVNVIDSTPAEPKNFRNITGNFWVNYTWEKGANTDSFNVWNGTWTNGTNQYFNTTVGPHNWSNITVYAYNASSRETNWSFPASQNTQVPNNPIIITNISDNYSLVEGQTLYIYANYTDADGASDLLTFNRNFTNGTFNKTTGVLNWTTKEGDDTPGNYSWQINVTDIYGSVSAMNFTVHVGDSTPGTPINLSNATGNFWVNHTWEKGANTDSFNVSYNVTWINGSSVTTWTNGSATSINATVGPHGWGNITVYGWNNTLKALNLTGRTQNTQVPNNIPSIPAKVAPVKWQNLSDGNVSLTWEKSTDEDGDNFTYDWQLSDSPGFSTTLQSGNTENLNADLSLPPGTYYWRVRANDSFGASAWNQSATPDFQIVSAPSIDNLRVLILTNNSIKIEWATNQSDSLNNVKYGYNRDLSNGSLSSWSNNPSITIEGLTGQSIYYQAFSYNASNSSANSSLGIYNFNYPLQVNLYYIEPTITNDNETWRPASRGHIGKFIGIDGNFKNRGEDSLVLTITAINKDKYSGPFAVTLAKDDNKSFMGTSLGRHAFEIDSNGVEGGFFNSTLQINVTGQNGTNFIFNYTNITTISLKLNPIFKIKRAIDGEGKETGEGRAIVSEGSTTTIRYILEANSSVNLTGVVIYDPFYPANQGGPFFNIQELKANEPKNVSYTYKATTRDLSSNKCEDLTPCLINLATFRGDIEPSGESIYDSDYVRIRVFPYITNSVSSSSGGGGSSSGGGGGVPLSEDFNNTERREVREMDIIAKSAATYVFKAADPVMAVAFESSVSENGVPVALEVLKNRSKFIGVDATGKLYKYFNVFVGMSGSSKKVSNGVVVFRVNNSWLEENDFDPKDISLYKWQGSEWIGKDTKIAEIKPNYTYYASAVGNFSSFAIAGTKKLKLASSSLTVPNIPMPADKSINESGNSTNLTSANSSLERRSGALKLGDIFIQFLRRLFSLIIG